MKNDPKCEAICSFIKKVVVDNQGKAVIIPDFNILSNPSYFLTPLEGCFCPRTSEELKKCLRGCLVKILSENVQHSSKVRSASIIDENGNESQLI